MEKLRKKIFYVLITILSLFITIILSIVNIKKYISEYNEIYRTLERGIKVRKQNDNPINNKLDFSEKNIDKNNQSFIFINGTVYVVTLDFNDNILEVQNNNSNNVLDEEIVSLATSIKNNHKESLIHIRNLYFQEYAYSYQRGNYIIIVDMSDIRRDLISTFLFSILILGLSEIFIIIIAQKITNWIIKPVEDTFMKQKQFIEDASHELKTPLSVIIAGIESLEESPKETKWFPILKNEANRMQKLLINMLDLAKIENSECDFYKVDLSRLIELETLTYDTLMYEQKLILETDIEPSIEYNCNSEEIKQLVAILLDNSLKHSSVNTKVHLNLQKNKNDIILEVINTGDPIPKGKEETIFDRFYRTDESRNRNDNRYGLGLAIAKSIVEKHQGKIEAKSEKGRTTFSVSLPLN